MRERALPAGPVTFLFTDIEASTRLLQALGDRYVDVLSDHRRLLREAWDAHGGIEMGTEGDSFFVVFERAGDAIAAALRAQRALGSHAWPEGTPVRVRMGMHTGEAALVGGDYVGLAVHQAARVAGVAFGGQVLVSGATNDLLAGVLPHGAALRDLGQHRLKDLARPERILQLVHADLADDFPPLPTLDARPHNLPIQLRSFVGRGEEMDEVRSLLASSRLVTLTGAGGVGKTSLALRVAAEAVDEHADGVWLVELQALTNAALVPQAVATALGLREQAGRDLRTTLLEHVRARALLLVLDNCEHLVAACADLAHDILASSSGARILATSRETLEVPGEALYRVPSLPVPAAGTIDPSSGAVRLFCERAAEARPGFTVDERNAAAVADICRRLDGIPLAIELAAARVRHLAPAEIAARLDDRFALLVSGGRGRVERHQALRATIDWSFDLLGADERFLFGRLAVFAGSFALEAAEAVGGPEPVLDVLGRLVDRSLVAVEDAGGATRYRLLETVRAYAIERLREAGDEDGARAALAAWSVAFADGVRSQLEGPDQASWLERIALEHDSLREALRWCASASPEEGLRIAGTIWTFWHVRGHFAEGRSWLETVLDAAPDALPVERVQALIGLGNIAFLQGDYAASRTAHGEAVSRARSTGDRALIARALNNLSNVYYGQGDHARAIATIDECVALAREVGDEGMLARAYNNRGNLALAVGDLDAAAARYEEAIAIFRRLGDTRVVAGGLNNLATTLYARGEFERAAALHREGLEMSRSLGDTRMIAQATNNLAVVLRAQGDPRGASTLFLQALPLFRELGTTPGVVAALEGLGGTFVEMGRMEEVARMFGAAAAFRESAGSPLPEIDREEHESDLARVRAALGGERFDRAWRDGWDAPLGDTVAGVLAADESATA